MILTIDIGNTNITFGCYDKKLEFVSRLATDRTRTADQYAAEFRMILRIDGAKIDDISGAVISSVVPELTKSICVAVEKITGIVPLCLGPGIKNGLNIKIDNPAQLGADMVATAVGAMKSYKLPCLIADLGTATKISVLSKNGEFLGCSIAPGVGISLKALTGGTSQLPALGLDTPKNAIGTNTITSMQSGIVYGTADSLDGMFDRLENELGEKIESIIATGGYAKDIIRHCRHRIIYDENLILDGLFAIYEKNQ